MEGTNKYTNISDIIHKVRRGYMGLKVQEVHKLLIMLQKPKGCLYTSKKVNGCTKLICNVFEYVVVKLWMFCTATFSASFHLSFCHCRPCTQDDHQLALKNDAL